MGDVDGDGDLDVVAGNRGQANRLYLNDGTGSVSSASDITGASHDTYSVALGDVDEDGDLDLVAGNFGWANRLYLNDGAGVFTGANVTTDAHDTAAVTLGDVDDDGDLDLVVGNVSRANRLHLNDGAGNFGAGSDITSDAHDTYSVVLGDVDYDGDLDLIAGNDGQADRLYLNDGTGAFGAGSNLTVDAHGTRSIVLADMDNDGDLDVATASNGQANRFYRGLRFYDAGRGRARSLEVDTVGGSISNATLTHTATLPPNTGVDYWLTNDGGARWYTVQPGVRFTFQTLGNDLRWRADLRSLSPVLTPSVGQIQIDSEQPGGPIGIGDRVWQDLDGDGIQDAGESGLSGALVELYDDQGTLLDSALTDAAGDYSFTNVVWYAQSYRMRFFPSPGPELAPQDQGSDDGVDSDADPATGFTTVFNLVDVDDDDRWDAGMVPLVAPCTPPDELLYIYEVGTTMPEGYPILNWNDWNQPDQITGYNVYRSSDPGLPHDQWTLVASDIVDGDGATPNNQWIDQSGDPGPVYYQVAAYNHDCPAETAEGPW
jgi:hypothetical protein